jgi:hypothetical protein
MKRIFNIDFHEWANPVIISLIVACLFTFSCQKIISHETLEEKMPAILVNMLNADDPVGYAERHGIKLKDGMARVIITVDKNFHPKEISGKYMLKDFQKREDLVTTYISIAGLKEIYKESSVVYIRLPVKFINNGKH